MGSTRKPARRSLFGLGKQLDVELKGLVVEEQVPDDVAQVCGTRIEAEVFLYFILYQGLTVFFNIKKQNPDSTWIMECVSLDSDEFLSTAAKPEVRLRN